MTHYDIVEVMKQMLLMLLVISNYASAEIFNCNGTWMNKPCSEEVLGKITEVQRTPRSAEAIARDQKQMIVHDLQTLKFDAERETGLTFLVSDVLAICNDQSSSLEDCTDKANQKVDTITKSMTDIKVSRESSKKEADAKNLNEPTDKNITITVVENRDPYYDRFPWYRPPRPINPRPPVDPIRPVRPEPPVIAPPEPIRKTNSGSIFGLQ